MKKMPDSQTDLILCDLPYGRTHNRWDTVIPFDLLWREYKRIIKDNGVIALFADGLFMAELMLSNKQMWRYNLVWDKVLASGFLNANRQPLRRHEEICIFYNKQPTYNPQKTKGKMNHQRGHEHDVQSQNYNKYNFVDNRDSLGDMKHPTSILNYQKPHPSVNVHPTQKPVELLEWIIRTYTNEGDTVLDSCMGSGSTGIACLNTNRNFIGIELDETYFKIAEERIKEKQNEVSVYR